jgi:Domain of Unknown Function (DUF1080)
MRSVISRTALVLLSLGLVTLEVGVSRLSAADKEKPDAKDTGWQPLFPKDDLTDWEYLKKHWSLANGELVGTNLPRGLSYRTFMCSKKKYKDFEIKFQVRVKGPVTATRGPNSGLNFRSAILDRKKLTGSGLQADIGEIFWGALSSEFIPGKVSTAIKLAPAKVLAKVKAKDFNDYYVKCVGKHVTIKLNGETTVDDDFAWMEDEGIIAWQVHANPTEVTFRDIQIKDLSANKQKGPNDLSRTKDDKPNQKKQ